MVPLGGIDVAAECSTPCNGTVDRLATGGLNADAQSRRAEIRRKHNRAVQLLEVGETERQTVLLLGVAECRPVQRHYLVVTQAFHTDGGIAADFVAAFRVLGEAEREIPSARIRNRLQLHFLQLQPLSLGVAADEARIEAQIGPQSAQLLLALGQRATQRARGDVIDLCGALKIGDLLFQIFDLAEQDTLLTMIYRRGRGVPAQRANDEAHHQQAA